MEYDPAEVPELIEPIVRGAADVVFGSRLSRRPAAARVPLLAPRRQPLPLAADERPLQHDALGHGDRLQGVPRSTCCARSTCARTSFGIEPEITGKVCKRKLRIYELPISYYGRTLRRGQEDHLARRLPGGLGALPRPRSPDDRGQDGRRRRAGLRRGGADRRDARRDPGLRRPDLRRRRRLARRDRRAGARGRATRASR